MYVTVVGIQRSGTNYLETLLRNNFENVKIQNQDSNFIWKHRVDPKDVADKLKKGGKDHMIFLIHKNPYKWIESLMKYNADLEKRNGGKPGEYDDKYKKVLEGDITVKDKRGKVSNVGGAIRLYNDLYNNWINTDLCHVHVVRYEDLLEEKSRSAALAKINETTVLKKKPGIQGWQNPDKVGQSDKWDNKKTQAYLNLEQFDRLGQEHIDLINKYIDRNLMNQFNYPVIEERGWSINKRRA